MNVFRSRLLATGRTSRPDEPAGSRLAPSDPESYMPTSIDVFAKAREHERLEQLQAARELDCAALLPRAGGPDAARRRDGGQAPDHARLQQLPRAHRRRARQAGRARRAQPLRHRADRLALPERHDRPAPRARARAGRLARAPRRALVFTTGHQANLGALGHDPRPGRHGGRRLRRPRLDPRRLHPLARQAAAVPPQPRRPAREHARRRPPATAAGSSSSSTACSRWRATSRRCPRSPSCAHATARG